MAALAQPTWGELQYMDETTIAAINIVKGEMNGDTFMWSYEDIDEDGVVTLGIWKSTLDAIKKKNGGKILEQEEED
jgi:hypothetical protein